MGMPTEKAKTLLELVAKAIVHGQEGFDSLELLANYSFDDIKQAKAYLLETSKNTTQYNVTFDQTEGLFRPTIVDMALPYDPSKSLESQGLERVVDAALTLGVLKTISIAGKQVVKIGEKYFAKLDDGSVVEVNQATANQLQEAYHYTAKQWGDAIKRDGLRPQSYATPNGDLSGFGAKLELSLPPTRNAPEIKVTIDLDAMRKDGYEIPTPTRVSNVVTDSTGRTYSMPGGGLKIKFPYKILPQYIKKVDPI
jgi:hypothetical protein